MSLKNKVILGAFALFALVVILRLIDLKISYVPTEATVTVVKRQCYLEKVEHNLLTRTTSTTKMMSCEDAKDLAANHPVFQGMTVKGWAKLGFEYTSPSDGVTHVGSFGFDNEDLNFDKQVGDHFTILVNKEIAEDYNKVI